MRLTTPEVQGGGSALTDLKRSGSAPCLLKQAAGIAKASGEPNKNKVGTVTVDQVRQIAETKMVDLNASSVEMAMNMIKGTARSMGILVGDEAPPAAAATTTEESQ